MLCGGRTGRVGGDDIAGRWMEVILDEGVRCWNRLKGKK